MADAAKRDAPGSAAAPVHLNVEQFLAGLAGQRAQPVLLITRTVPEMRKRGNPLVERGVCCVAGRNGFLGSSYGRAVNRQRYREGRPTNKKGQVIDFRPDQLWNGQGEHVADNRHLVRHKRQGTLYVKFQPQRELWRRYEYADTLQPIDAAEVEPWLKRSTGRRRQQTDKQIPLKTIKPESILRFRLGGILYVLKHPAEVAA